MITSFSFLILLDCQCNPAGTVQRMIEQGVQLLCPSKNCKCQSGFSGKQCQCAKGFYERNGKCEGIV